MMAQPVVVFVFVFDFLFLFLFVFVVVIVLVALVLDLVVPVDVVVASFSRKCLATDEQKLDLPQPPSLDPCTYLPLSVLLLLLINLV